MKFIAEINVMPLKELLDPQGKTVSNNLKNLGIEGVEDVRIGKHIKLNLEAGSDAEAKEKVEQTCKRLLANMVMESYSYTVQPA